MGNDSSRHPVSRREGIVLLMIGVLAFAASAAAFYGQIRQPAPHIASAVHEDDVSRIPLPAGPRKYQ